jgi:hypothetical protein
MLVLVLSCMDGLIGLQANTLSKAIYYWILFGITLTLGTNLGSMLYGIATNTTPNEMFESHKNPQLWRKIDYVTYRNILTRVYKNSNRKDVQSNIQDYLNM